MNKQSSKKVSKAELEAQAEMRKELQRVSDTATPDDRTTVSDIIAKAKSGKRLAGLFVLSPAVCAILFLHHNPHNRDWRAVSQKTNTREYARRMSAGEWQFITQSIGFYDDGAVCDGQHRLSAAALAGFTLEVFLCFGAARGAAVAIDDIGVRTTADALALDGITRSFDKTVIIDGAFRYMRQRGDKEAALVLKDGTKKREVVREEDPRLDDALAIVDYICSTNAKPVLKPLQAATAAYLMMIGGWKPLDLKDKFGRFLSGISPEGEKHPYFVAATLIQQDNTSKDKLSTTRQLAAAIKAMVDTESGTKAINPSTFKQQIRKTLPNPMYPEPAKTQPAAADGVRGAEETVPA